MARLIIPFEPPSSRREFTCIASPLPDCRHVRRRAGPEPCTRWRVASTEAARAIGAGRRREERPRSGALLGLRPLQAEWSVVGEPLHEADRRADGGAAGRTALGPGQDFAYPDVSVASHPLCWQMPIALPYHQHTYWYHMSSVDRYRRWFRLLDRLLRIDRFHATEDPPDGTGDNATRRRTVTEAWPRRDCPGRLPAGNQTPGFPSALPGRPERPIRIGDGVRARATPRHFRTRPLFAPCQAPACTERRGMEGPDVPA